MLLYLHIKIVFESRVALVTIEQDVLQYQYIQHLHHLYCFTLHHQRTSIIRNSAR